MSKKNNFKVPVNQLTSSYRTKFPLDHTVKGSFNHGLLIPFDVIECLPGDTFKIDVASILRMSTPIAPIMDNIHMHLAAYFVPNRIIYDNWEQLMGTNKTGAWLSDQSTYYVPQADFAASLGLTGVTHIPVGSIGDYMGLPGCTADGGVHVYLNALPGRCYAMIWNEYYRSPVVSAPLPVDHTSTGTVLVQGVGNSGDPVYVSANLYDSDPLPLAKYADYFTKCLPQPIKHDPIPFIANNLPVGVIPTGSGTLASTEYPTLGTGRSFSTGVLSQFVSASSGTSSPGVTGGPVIAEALSQNWNTIEALRTAFQLDKFYYKDSYARNYRDMLQAHFNVDNKDSVLQLPQKIGELRWRINVDQVLSTAGYAASSSTTVGAPGANSVTTGKGSLTTFSVTEHGFIIIVGGTRHDHTYGQGFEKLWLRNDRLDFYDPCFARIGDQPVELHEVYAQFPNDGTNPNMSVFGYQEAWAEYRFKPDRVCGILKPSVSGSLDFWTLADNFAAAPQLNETFIYENRNSLQRALVTGSSGPDFIFDMFFKVTAVREMPLFSVPGLADHF